MRNRRRRFGRNFFHFLRRLIRRVGLRNGRIAADWHQGEVQDVEVTARSHRQPRPAGGVAVAAREYTVAELTQLFQLRLRRLLRCLAFPFGRVEIKVKNSDIAETNFIVSARPDEGRRLDRLFRR